MVWQVMCKTRFDITATGVKSNYNKNRIPFVDKSGRTVNNIERWHFARNQQRNWETINQLISLRTIPLDISNPVKHVDNGISIWQFDFSIQDISTLSNNADQLGGLKRDCEHVPMLTGLEENAGTGDWLVFGDNILFSVDNKY